MSELVDLSKLNAPKVLEDLNFETLLTERKAEFIALFPQEEQDFWRARLNLESEPITKLLQEVVYLQLLERSRINQAAQATMLAYATGSDLDVIAANFNVQRQIIQTEDNSVTPKILAILEDDTSLRLRTQLAFEGLSVAGPRSAYVFHALSAHPEVADVSVISPEPAQVTVTILSRIGQGTASEQVLNAVRKKLNDENIRPIGDRVTVQSAVIHSYNIRAKLHLYRGPEYEPIKAEALKKLTAYTEEKRRLGRDISLSGIYAALHLEGVQRVELLSPSADIVLPSSKSAYCTDIHLEVVTSDDY
ncbi:baseplate assembly protein [Rodentibacter pneumotropicus]|uniref:Baseplate assembly protein n=1 Tax=Rodentibacter pneumotropicus TaxID=758 RepID=A0A4S2PCZ6_9PAST|nr:MULTISPECIES: baseplate J/gp47 family protein [Pasteurellaceae]TGY50823.1 baseplate assembly protein [Pasteurella caecimuris]TGZ98517.1 baseplate assembly protein [Rodentibacter pneumotropicus]THA00949.1 baseplate assembly protein [Rodentibacter pneumotropicus]THA05109.1 baseplate assembly protein [Rodentibacter pneumotropicus]THA08191.1 baseplate assembly protein [Rodentibacter pneumotropicus]